MPQGRRLGIGPKDVAFGTLVGVLCYLAAQLGGVLMIQSPQTLWPLWPGCALLAGILMVTPKEKWRMLIPAGLVGFAAYDWQTGVPKAAIGWLLLTDAAEMFVLAAAVKHVFKGEPRLDSLRALAKYSFFAILLGPLLVATIGIQALDGDPWIAWRSVFLSEGLAFLTITPAVLGWAGSRRAWWRERKGYGPEMALLVSSLLLLSYVIFVALGANARPALLYSLLPFFLWSSLRFGSTGAGTSSSIVALISIAGAVHGMGPFPTGDPISQVFSLQLFLLLMAVPFMVLAVLVEEQKRQGSILRESEERFRLMADSTPTLIWMSATDKRCTFFNRGWLQFRGREMKEELGEGWIDGVHPEDLERCLSTYTKAFDLRERFEMGYRLRRYDGEYRWIINSGVPRFASNGTFCGYIGSCVDVTELKLSEISLRELTGRLIRAQEEERARIARELHDDISQRMAYLQIGLEQFEQQASGMLPAGRKELLNLTGLVSEVSSDLHSISHQLHPARLDLQGLVAAIGSYCRELARNHGLAIEFKHHDVPDELSVEVALCLFRIVQEALRNVVKHGDTAEAKVELFAQGDVINLCVSDDGAGFDPANPQNGGLGLVSMRERMRLIGGKFSIESAPARGTRVRIQVPLVPKTEERPENLQPTGQA